MSALAHNTQNDTRLAEYEAFVREKGREDAMGKDALPGLAVGFVRAVYDAVIDPAKDKNGEDAATRTFKLYAASSGKKAYHDRSAASQKVQVSKFKQLEKAAGNPKWDFVDILNRAIVIRQKAMDDEIEVKSPFPAYVDVAREQLKLDDEMSDDMIFATVTKSESTREVTLEGQLKKAAKILEDIITGEKHPGICDQSQEVITASEQLNARISGLVTLRETQEKLEKAIEMGFVKNEDGSWSMP